MFIQLHNNLIIFVISTIFYAQLSIVLDTITIKRVVSNILCRIYRKEL